MPNWICATCCAEFADSASPPAVCPICADERQYVPEGGQKWTTMAEIGREHRNEWREIEAGLFGLGVTPSIGIGQRALVVRTAQGNVMWDCVPLVSEAVVAEIRAIGGLAGISVSHPHMYSAVVSWSEALGGVPIHLPEADKACVTRQSELIRFWEGERFEIVPGVTLYRCGGHFAGSAVLHWAAGAGGKGALFTGDTIQVVPDTRWVSFMRSYPNLIPLPAEKVRQIAGVVKPLKYDRIYGAWWDRVVKTDAHAAVERSAARYIAAIAG